MFVIKTHTTTIKQTISEPRSAPQSSGLARWLVRLAARLTALQTAAPQKAHTAQTSTLGENDYLAERPLQLWQKRLLAAGTLLLLALGTWATLANYVGVPL